jgi:Holliday junction resolvase RusA-like endonuclease
MLKITIPMKLPGLNEYISACKVQKGRWNKGNQMKQEVQAEMVWYLKKLPKLHNPVTIKFIWVSEHGDRRDLDNICFAKKFILDALQQCGKLTNDNRKYVVGFTDEFVYGEKYEIRLEIEELNAYKLKEE